MKRLLAVVLPAALLTSCSLVDMVGPKPNAEVMELARQSTADEQVLEANSPARSLRAKQADQLIGEARRLCGSDPEGMTPASCDTSMDDSELPVGHGDLGEMITQVRSMAVSAIGSLPDSSIDLVVAQAIDTTALAPVSLDNVSLTNARKADIDAARAMLQTEYQLEYGLGLATAWADQDGLALIDATRSASDERRAALISALEPTGDVPEPPAGYEFQQGTEPTDAASAYDLVTQLLATTTAQWRSSAAAADSSQWRDAAILCAAHAQRNQP